jgi:hypothetical protein
MTGMSVSGLESEVSDNGRWQSCLRREMFIHTKLYTQRNNHTILASMGVRGSDINFHVSIWTALSLFLAISLSPTAFSIADTIISSDISTSTTWTTAGGTYIVQGSRFVNAGVTLTIDPGVVVKFQNTTSRLVISGTLNATGTSTSRIYFTSLKDDSVGGDTNGDGASTTPVSLDWHSVQVEPGGIANLEYVTIRYGGSSIFGVCNTGGENVCNNGGTLTISSSTISNGYYGINHQSGTTSISNTTISDASFRGLNILAGMVSVATSTFSNNASHGLFVDGGLVAFNGNTFSGHTICPIYFSNLGSLSYHSQNTASGPSDSSNGICLNGNVTQNISLTPDTIPYVIFTTSEIHSGNTLTINPGAVVKFRTTSGRLTVFGGGTLNAIGSSLYPIYFTSIKDDSVMGDTNGDGASTTPALGDWNTILVNSTGVLNLGNAIVRYGGRLVSGVCNSERQNICNNGGTITIATSTISHGFYGINQRSGTTHLLQSVIRNNSSNGARNIVSATSSFMAIDNYWNAFSGPYHPQYNASGTGQQISSFISFNPWLGSTNYTHLSDSVDDANEEMLWKWATTTESQTYATELAAAIATWNALDPINLSETAGVPDVEVREVDASPQLWSGRYTPSTPGFIELNLSQIGTDPLSRIQRTWTHELGHALGLDHSYWENVMYLERTTQTSLGDQDIADYHALWGY